MNIRKRYFITLFITCIFLALTYPFWLVKPLVDVEFNLTGNQEVKINVSLGSKKCDEKKVKLSGENSLSFKIDKKGSFRVVDIKISDIGDLNDKFTLSNVRLRNNKYKLDNLEQFKIVGAKSYIESNKLILKPTSGDIVISYKIKGKPAVSFKFYIFLSILIIGYMLSLKLVLYFTEFKVTKKYSRADIVFLLLFFIFLFVPMSHINHKEISIQENRRLEPIPSILMKDGSLNLKYGKIFDKSFNDRFAFRSTLLNLIINIRYVLNINYCHNNSITFSKCDNLMWRGSFWGLSPIVKDKNDVLKTYAYNVNKLQEYCNHHNIKLYILVVPRKAEFFDYSKIRAYSPDPAEEVLDYLGRNTKTDIIYPKEAMLEANKETPVYFKTDHHWTKKGAYVGYYELIKEIKKDFPATPVLEENSLEKFYDNRVSEWWNREFNNGQTFDQLCILKKFAKKILDTPYLYYKNPNKQKLILCYNLAPIPEEGGDSLQDNQFYYPDGLDKKIMVIANSFAANLVEFLPYSFKYTVRYYDNYRGMKLSIYENAINEYKPDILVINVYTPYLRALLNLYPNKYSEYPKTK